MATNLQPGSVRDEGNQYIGWKYYTPLKADYINTFMGQVITPGLVTRPRVSVSIPDADSSGVITFQIHPFTAYVEPEDAATWTDENNKTCNSRLVKVTMSEVSDMHSAGRDTVAIGMTYSLINTETGANRTWYAVFYSLTAADIPTFKGIIIATIQNLEYPLQDQTTDPPGFPEHYHYNISTSGADISNVLLEKEGWNPDCWLSLISPRRAFANGQYDGNAYNKFELRHYNDALDYTITGRNGMYNLTNKYVETLIIHPQNENRERFIDPTGFRGFMENNITVVCLNTKEDNGTVPGIQTQGAESFSAMKNLSGGIKGGVVAYIDATENNKYKDKVIDSVDYFNPNQQEGAEHPYAAICVFANSVILKPAHSEVQSISKFEYQALYTEYTLVSGQNPQALGMYEYNSSTGTYSATSDTSVVANKKYYTNFNGLNKGRLYIR